MLSSINPVGEMSRGQRWIITVIAFTVGSLAGGTLVGTVLGAMGVVVDPPRWVALTTFAIGAIASLVADSRRVTPPSLRRQVNRHWMTTYRGWVYGAGFGVQLGAGVTTYITSWTTWLWIATMVLVGNLPVAMTMGALFGLVRAISVWTTTDLATPDALRHHHRRLQSIHPAVATTSTLVLAAAAALAVVGLVA